MISHIIFTVSFFLLQFHSGEIRNNKNIFCYLHPCYVFNLHLSFSNMHFGPLIQFSNVDHLFWAARPISNFIILFFFLIFLMVQMFKEYLFNSN